MKMRLSVSSIALAGLVVMILSTAESARALDLSGGGTATTTFYAGGVVFSDGTKLTQASGSGNGFFTWNSATNRLGIGTSTPWGQISINPNGITGPSFVIGSTTATDFIVTNAGRVGVGTKNPFNKLHIDAGGINSMIQITNDATGHALGDGTYMGHFAGNGGFYLMNQEANNLVFGTNSLAHVYIDFAGRVGIASSTPFALLSVNPSATTYPSFIVGSSSATNFIITNAGYVGVNTTAPQYVFDVKGTPRVAGDLVLENTAITPTKGSKLKWSVFAASSTYQYLSSAGIALYASTSTSNTVYQGTPLFLMHSNADQSATAPTLFPNSPGAAIGEDGGTYFRTNAFDIYSTNGLRQLQVIANPTITSGAITAVTVISSANTYDRQPTVIAYDYAQATPGATYGTGATFTANMTGSGSKQSVASITVNTQGSNYSPSTIIFVQPSVSAPLDVGPQINLTRDVPNTGDYSNLGYIMFQGRSSGAAGADTIYGAIGTQVLSTTTKSGRIVFATGGLTADATELFPRAYVGKGIYTLNSPYQDMGLDSISTKNIYVGTTVAGTSTITATASGDTSYAVNATVYGNGSLAISGAANTGAGSVGVGGTANNANNFPGYFANSYLGTSCIIGNSAGGPTCSSDERLKENIVPIDGALAKLQMISGITFNWKNAKEKRAFLGVLAQDVLKAFPDAVSTSQMPLDSSEKKESYYSVDYAVLVAPAIQGINEISRISGYFREQLTSWLGERGNGVDRLCLDDVCVTKAQLAALLASQNLEQAPETKSGKSSAPKKDDTVTLILNGNETSTIPLGSTFMDLGVKVLADNPALQNLPIETILNGAHVDQITIDTSSAATHTIEYVLRSSNPSEKPLASVERTIIVGDSNSATE